MPLRDHFHPPLSERRSWDGLYGGWPAVIVQRLNQVLPPQSYAEPRVHLGGMPERDVAAYSRSSSEDNLAESNQGGIADAVWTATQPTLAVETDLADFDEYEVRIYDAQHGRRLVAAIELISPANKDRPEHRAQFVSKCAALLRQEVSVVLVDVVTSRDFNLYAELLAWIDEEDPSLNGAPPSTYAVACRWVPRGASHRLEAWNRRLAVGDPLPVLPLWLTEDLAISLDLEASYEQTCRDLRIV